MTQLLLRLYKTLLHLYSKQFHATYRQEMVSVFSETIEGESGFNSAILFLREVLDLPSSNFRIYAANGLKDAICPHKMNISSLPRVGRL